MVWTLESMYLFKLAFSFFFFFKYIPRSRLAGSHGSSSFFFLKKISVLFSTVTVSIYLPTNGIQGFLFLNIFANVLFVAFLMIAILTGPFNPTKMNKWYVEREMLLKMFIFLNLDFTHCDSAIQNASSKLSLPWFFSLKMTTLKKI